MHRADLAMYQVKQAGRGHWRVAPFEAAWTVRPAEDRS
jgi:hypothetical protein